jgi:hypothetical protein
MAAACHVLEPAGGECDDQLLVAVVGVVLDVYCIFLIC